MNKLKDIDLFLLDLDGTFYLGDKLLPGAIEFLNSLKKHFKTFVFLTNNSSSSNKDYVEKLKKYGVNIESKEVFTSSEATLIYLKENGYSKNIALFGTKSLENEFILNGYTINFKNPDYIVLGFDKTITYEKLTLLCNLVRSGIPYIATHPDLNCPIENGYIPDTGSMIEFVKASTNRYPDVIIGKPNRYIVDAVSKKFNIPLNKICMVGDRLYTDIRLGNNAPIKTVLVLSGETSLEEYNKQKEVKATLVKNNISELIEEL